MKTEMELRIIGVSKDRKRIFTSEGFTIESTSGPFDLDKLNGFLKSLGKAPLKEMETTKGTVTPFKF